MVGADPCVRPRNQEQKNRACCSRSVNLKSKHVIARGWLEDGERIASRQTGRNYPPVYHVRWGECLLETAVLGAVLLGATALAARFFRWE
jgi:hypothetical protein